MKHTMAIAKTEMEFIEMNSRRLASALPSLVFVHREANTMPN
jgi:hypothetical protein